MFTWSYASSALHSFNMFCGLGVTKGETLKYLYGAMNMPVLRCILHF